MAACSWAIALWICAIAVLPTRSQEPWKIEFASNYTLEYFNYAANYGVAKALCKRRSGIMIHMNNEQVRNKVYEDIQSANVGYFWIGATGIMKNWKWLGRTSTADISFITWAPRQPDNYDGKEDRLVVGKLEKYSDVQKTFNNAGTICQIAPPRNRIASIYELVVYDFTRNFEKTKKLCEGIAGRVVQMDDEEVRTTVNKTLKSPTLVEHFWIGATRSNNYWTWLSGTRADYLVEDAKWYSEDNYEGKENNVVIRAQDGQYGDITSEYKFGTICQRRVVFRFGSGNLTIHRHTASGEAINVTYDVARNKCTQGDSRLVVMTNETRGILSPHLKNSEHYWVGGFAFAATCPTYSKSAKLSSAGCNNLKPYICEQASQPTILSIQPHSCNSSLTITWKPHRRAVGITHNISVYEDDDIRSHQSETPTPIDYSNQVVSFNNLRPSTFYRVIVSIGIYSDTKSNYTGGIPQPVEAALLTKSDESCKVSWNWPQKTPHSLITGYRVNTTYTTARVFPGVDRTFEHHEETVSTLSFTIPRRPNRNHTVTIDSQTCAGNGTSVIATGSCVTGVAAPKSVEKLSGGTGRNVVSEDGNMNFTMKPPNESNGPISCVFVIVETGNSAKYNGFTESDLKEANGTGKGTRYIAIAFDRQSMVGKPELNITLGNGSRSTCNIRKQPKTRRKRDISDDNSYVGQNHPLSTEKSYKIYVATTTPSDNAEVFFQISEPLVVQPLQPSQSSTWIIPLVVSLVVILLLASGAIVIFLRRRNTLSDTPSEKRDFGIENAHADGAEKPADEVDIPIPSPSAAVNTEQGQAVYENRKDDTTLRMPDFEEYYKRLCQENCSLFKSQFKTIKELSTANMKSTSIAANPELKKKNRYKNILPYDSTRVVIKGNETGYINACYVDGFRKERKFIATQGPLASTENDFWLMVVENECKMIVMVAKCFEAGKKKCQKYWPDEGKTEKYGKITVQNATEIKSCGFIQRKFRVSTENETTYVQQFQYLNWPDHGIPNTTSSLVRMHKAVVTSLKQEQTVTPVIVHCSAGAGRTGTFIGYDYLVEQTSSEDQVDVLKCVLMMRSHRVDMIQNCDQYILVHKLVLEHYLFADSDLDPQDITQKLHDMERGPATKGLSKEFEDLSRLAPVKNISNQDNEDCNVVLIIPRPGEPAPPSLNASWVESYDENSPMMAAEAPDRISSSLFWRAVSDNRVNTIITLNGTQEKERYWPTAVGDDESFGDVVVNLLSENNSGVVVQRVLQISNGCKQSTVTQYHYSAWDVKNCPKDTRYILELVENMQKNTRKENGAASVITCSDGTGRSGTYCAIVNLIERLKTENKVDVFRAVKDLRDCRPGMVKTLDQYVFCHQVIIDYLKSFDIYSNFG